MNRPQSPVPLGCKPTALVIYIMALNEYIDWLEGKGDHHDRTEVSHDTEHVCEDEAGPIPDRSKGHTLNEGGTQPPCTPGCETTGA